MKISGFTMAKNASKLYYPIKEAILSILPIVDEFVVAIGKGDDDDTTLEDIRSIASPKIKIVETVWNIKKYPRGTENAHQTDIAKSHCTGDWLFYLQADEVVHEKYLPTIKAHCEKYLNDKNIEALLFNYLHFWGDYDHHRVDHGWYKKEIRIVRNNPEIHSWESAQSFRRIPNFDGKDYRQQAGTYKLKAAIIPAYVYHYGWVRPPRLMQTKKKALHVIHVGEKQADINFEGRKAQFDYGPLGRAEKFNGTHPEVMKDWIAKLDWAEELNYSKNEITPDREKFKHDKFKYRVLTFLEQKVFKRELGGFKNFILVK